MQRLQTMVKGSDQVENRNKAIKKKSLHRLNHMELLMFLTYKMAVSPD